MARKTRVSVYDPTADPDLTETVHSMTEVEKLEMLRLLYQELSDTEYRSAIELDIPLYVVEEIKETADEFEREILARAALSNKRKKGQKPRSKK